MSGTGALRQFVPKAVRLVWFPRGLWLPTPRSRCPRQGFWNEHARIFATRGTADALDALDRPGRGLWGRYSNPSRAL